MASSPTKALDILLVEQGDEDAELAIRVLLKSKLTQQIVRLKDGTEAINYLFRRGSFSERPEELPHLVLMDWRMQQKSGMEVLQSIKGEGSMNSMRVVILLSAPDERKFLEESSIGADSYLVKPITVAALRDLVVKLDMLSLSDLMTDLVRSRSASRERKRSASRDRKQ